LTAAVWVLFAPVLTVAEESPDFFLLDLAADGYRLAESVPVYASGDTYLIDFALFLEAVEFPIERKGRLWSGWSRSEDRQFSWRMDSGVVQLVGRDGGRVEDHEWMDEDDATYVSVGLLERWFKLQLDVDPRLQTLTVNSSEPLPFQLWRERTLAKFRHRSGQRIDADIVVPDQYKWATVPLFNLSTHVLTEKQVGGRNTVGTASLAMGMDLLKHSVIYTGGITHSHHNQGDSTNRLTIERASATSDTPLFAGVNRYILGDIYQANPNLVINSGTGRGFRIERYPAGWTTNLSQVTITGDAPPGWEVELYRNGMLIEFATVGADGRYLFPNQETSFGENTFVAKLFGPQGHTQEDRQTFWGGGMELDKGDYDFSISHIDFDRQLLDGAPDNVAGLTASYATDFRYARALTRDLQLGTAYTRSGLGAIERDGTFTDSQYVTLFGRMKLGRGVLISEAVHQLDFGEAWSLEYLTGLNGHTISVAHRAFNDYESPATLHRDDLDALNDLSLSGLFGRDKPIAYTLRLRHRQLAAGSSDFRVFNRLSLKLGPVYLSNDLEHIVTSGPSTSTGRLRLASRVNRVTLRGQLDYQLTGGQLIQQISTMMNWDMTDRLNNNLTITKNLSNDQALYFTNLLSIRIRDYNLTLSVSSNLDDAWAVGAGFNIAFGYDRSRQSFVTDNRSLANTGRATMNLFIDNNNNGFRDSDEPPVAWASYRDRESLQMSPGVLSLTALPSSSPVQIETRHFKFDDPFLVPRAQAYELRTHAGSDISVDVAVLMTGDIEGQVFVGSADDAAAARGIIVSLHDVQGREIARTRSEFDGYYSFTGIPGGDYSVRIDAKGGRTKIVQRFSLDAQDGYVVLDRTYIYE
jgi:hypothetical protein